MNDTYFEVSKHSRFAAEALEVGVVKSYGFRGEMILSQVAIPASYGGRLACASLLIYLAALSFATPLDLGFFMGSRGQPRN
jgi:hypothetical protein